MMFHHTVLIETRAPFGAEAAERFAEFRAEILAGFPGVRFYELVPNEAPSRGPYNLVLFSAFADRSAFEAYDRSALHGRLKALFGPLLVSLVVADAEVSGPAPDRVTPHG